MQGPKNSLNYLVLSVGEMAKYPLIIYPGLLKGIFGYIIPYAYVSYYPAGFLLGKNRHVSRMSVTVSCLFRDVVVISSVPETWAGKI